MIVLDTHAWVWWVNDPMKLSGAARAAIAQHAEEKRIAISCMSAWEVAMLVEHGRLQLDRDVRDWISATETLPFVRFVPVDNSISVTAVRLQPPFHADPADRLIVATAIHLGAVLVTRDERIRAYPYVETIW